MVWEDTSMAWFSYSSHNMEICKTAIFQILLVMNKNIKLCQPMCIRSLFETFVSNAVYIALND